MRFGSRYCEDVVLFFGICTTTGKHEVWTMNPPSPTIGPDLFSRNDSSTLNILDCAGAIRTEIGGNIFFALTHLRPFVISS